MYIIVDWFPPCYTHIGSFSISVDMEAESKIQMVMKMMDGSTYAKRTIFIKVIWTLQIGKKKKRLNFSSTNYSETIYPVDHQRYPGKSGQIVDDVSLLVNQLKIEGNMIGYVSLLFFFCSSY